MRGSDRTVQKMMFHITFPYFICIAAVLLLMGGCAGPRAALPGLAVDTPAVDKQEFPGFLIVTARTGDTLASLAARHLNDPSLDWIIADFNRIGSVSPGQELVIPLYQYDRGGLSSEGYQTVPVLNYHKFSLRDADKLTVTKDSFEQQMKFLRDNGYRVLTLDQFFDFLDFKTQIPKKSVVITIDDGWRSSYDIAYPILKQYGYPATYFIYTDLITGSQKTLSWDMVRELSENGFDIQQHTKTHRNLTAPSKKETFREYFDALEKEFTVSAKLIKSRINKDVKYVAYPYGDTNHLVMAMLKKLGYRGAFTVKRGGSAFFFNNYSINRSMVYGDFDLRQFEESLSNFDSEAMQ